jgi:membrane carboxypeptidase/penicillin-binding protein PbpC
VGNIAASLTTRIDSRDLPHTTLQIHVADTCSFTSWPAMADTARFAGPFDHHVEEPDGSVFEMTTGPDTEAWTPIAEISPFLVHAVLAHEDASFFEHSGFAPWAIREALIRDLTAGRYVAGGSTITMQLVKNVFLHREKTLARKIQEVLLTWWLETRMDKEHILELYLNVIEYGPGVYGIRHAAEHYFGRSPADLSPAESAYLALILPNPPAFHEQYVAGEIPRAFRNRIANFVRVCGARGRYDEAAVAYGVAEAETLSFHREGDPPPPARTTEGAVASIPQIQFFSTVPLARLAVDETQTGDETHDDTSDSTTDAWDQEYAP